MTTCACLCNPTNCYAAVDLEDAQAALHDYHQAFERILTIHGPDGTRGVTCKGCDKAWPCPTTVTALASPHEARDG